MIYILKYICILATGEANFSLGATSLTVGGFNQPVVAQSLIEMPGNNEKGLTYFLSQCMQNSVLWSQLMMSLLYIR